VRLSVKTLLLSVAVLVIFAAPTHAAGIEPWNKNCLKDYSVWKKKGPHKAVAVTRVFPDGQGCGMSWEYETVAKAKAEALRRCKKQLKRNHPESRSSCAIIEVK
jgi:hypothetical protein